MCKHSPFEDCRTCKQTCPEAGSPASLSYAVTVGIRSDALRSPFTGLTRIAAELGSAKSTDKIQELWPQHWDAYQECLTAANNMISANETLAQCARVVRWIGVTPFTEYALSVYSVPYPWHVAGDDEPITAWVTPGSGLIRDWAHEVDIGIFGVMHAHPIVMDGYELRMCQGCTRAVGFAFPVVHALTEAELAEFDRTQMANSAYWQHNRRPGCPGETAKARGKTALYYTHPTLGKFRVSQTRVRKDVADILLDLNAKLEGEE